MASMTWKEFKEFVESKIEDADNKIIWYIDISYPSKDFTDVIVNDDNEIVIS